MMLGLGLSITRGQQGSAYPGADLVLDPYGRYGAQIFRKGSNSYQTLAAMIAAGDATFSRASDAYLTLANGTLQNFTSGQARNAVGVGFLPEEGRTNLLLRSQEFDNASWVKAALTVTANAATAPDGTLTADKLIPTATTADHDLYGAATVVNGTTYCASGLFKVAGKRYLTVFGTYTHWGTQDFATYDLQTGLVTQAGSSVTATATMLADGRVRFTHAMPCISSGTGRIYFSCGDNPTPGRSSVSTGNGTDGVFAWGAQLEDKSFALSYIPTTTAAASRAADNLSVPYSIPAGDFDVEVRWRNAASPPQTIRLIEFHNGSDNERLFVTQTSAGVVSAFVVNGGVSTQIGSNAAGLTGARDIAVVLKRRGGDWTFEVDGAQVGSALTAAKPTITTLGVGYRRNGTEYANTPIHSVVVTLR